MATYYLQKNLETAASSTTNSDAIELSKAKSPATDSTVTIVAEAIDVSNIVNKLAAIYGNNKAALQDIYLLNSTAGLNVNGKDAVAQLVANALSKQGFTNVKVHAIAPAQDKPATDMTVQFNSNHIAGKSIEAFSTNKDGEKTSLMSPSKYTNRSYENYYNLPHNTFTPNKSVPKATYAQIQVMNFMAARRIEYELAAEQARQNPENFKEIGKCDKNLQNLSVLEDALMPKNKDGSRGYVSVIEMQNIFDAEARKRGQSAGLFVIDTTKRSSFMQEVVNPLREFISQHAVTKKAIISLAASDKDIEAAKRQLSGLLTGDEFSVLHNPNDKELQAFVMRMNVVIKDSRDLEAIKGAITDVQNATIALKSPSMQEMKAQIQEFRTKATSFFAIGMGKKADQLEAAVNAVPVLERGNLMNNQSVLNALDKKQHTMKDRLAAMKDGFTAQKKENPQPPAATQSYDDAVRQANQPADEKTAASRTPPFRRK